MSTPIVMRTKEQQSPFSSSSAAAAINIANKQGQYARPSYHHPTQPAASSLINPQLSAQQQQQQKSECEIYFSGKHDALYIYLARLMAPIWDLKILNDLQPKTTSSSDSDSSSLMFVTFADINLQWYLTKLNELRRFIDINYPHLKTLHHSYLTSSLFQQQLQQQQSVVVGSSGSQTPANSAAAIASSRFATQFGSMPLNMASLMTLVGSGSGNLNVEIFNLT